MQRLITPAGLFSPSSLVDRFLAPNCCELAFPIAFLSDTQDVHFSPPVGSRRRRLGLHSGRWDPKHTKLTFKIIACTFPRGRTHLLD